MLLVQRPLHLSAQEALDWLRGQAAEFATAVDVRGVVLHRVCDLSWRYSREWDWMFEVDVDASGEPDAFCHDFLGDLRILGMGWAVGVVDAPVVKLASGD